MDAYCALLVEMLDGVSFCLDRPSPEHYHRQIPNRSNIIEVNPPFLGAAKKSASVEANRSSFLFLDDLVPAFLLVGGAA